MPIFTKGLKNLRLNRILNNWNLISEKKYCYVKKNCYTFLIVSKSFYNSIIFGLKKYCAYFIVAFPSIPPIIGGQFTQGAGNAEMLPNKCAPHRTRGTQKNLPTIILG